MARYCEAASRGMSRPAASQARMVSPEQSYDARTGRAEDVRLAELRSANAIAARAALGRVAGPGGNRGDAGVPEEPELDEPRVDARTRNGTWRAPWVASGARAAGRGPSLPGPGSAAAAALAWRQPSTSAAGRAASRRFSAASSPSAWLPRGPWRAPPDRPGAADQAHGHVLGTAPARSATRRLRLGIVETVSWATSAAFRPPPSWPPRRRRRSRPPSRRPKRPLAIWSATACASTSFSFRPSRLADTVLNTDAWSSRSCGLAPLSRLAHCSRPASLCT